jgi:hypothetical protein
MIENRVRDGAHTLLVIDLFTDLGELPAMVAFNRIRCKVVSVSGDEDRSLSRGALARNVLPWADPYVAQLIEKLQKEVREERRLQSRVRHYRTNGAEAAAA